MTTTNLCFGVIDNTAALSVRLAQLANQVSANGQFPCNVTYNYNNQVDWTNWASFYTGYSNYISLQLSPCPRGTDSNNPIWSGNSDIALNHQSDFNNFASNLAANGQSKCVGVQILWEWNQGGINCPSNGFDQANGSGRQDYITAWRGVATAMKNIAPNVPRFWAMNQIIMNFGRPEDYYPGDDLVTGCTTEGYQAYIGGVGNAGGTTPNNSVNNNFGWMDNFSSGTFLGANHLAKATGSMTLSNGVVTPIPVGGKLYCGCAEFAADLNQPGGSTYVTDTFNWINANPTRANKWLMLGYWTVWAVGNSLPTVDGSNNPSNSTATQIVANMNGVNYSGRSNPPSLAVVATSVHPVGFSHTATFGVVTASKKVPPMADPLLDALILALKPYNILVEAAPVSTIESADKTLITTVGPSIDASPTPGLAGSGNIMQIASNGTITCNAAVITGTANVDRLYYTAHTVYQRSAGFWYGPVTSTNGGVSVGDPTVAGGAETADKTLITTSGPTMNTSPTPGAAGSGNVLVITGTATVTINNVTIGAAVSVDQLYYLGHIAYCRSNGTWHGPVIATGIGPVVADPTLANLPESPPGTTVLGGSSATINASPTPGTPGTGNQLSITAGAAIQSVYNGVTGTFGSAVTELFYIGNTCFQKGTGLYYGGVTTNGGSGPVPNPHPTVILAGLVSGSISIPSGSPNGTVIGALSVGVGAGTYSWTYSVSGPNSASAAISGSNLVTNGALAIGSYGPFTVSASNPTIVGSPFTLSVTLNVTTLESPAGTWVPVNATQLNVGATPGTPGFGQIIQIINAQIVVNGGTPMGGAVTDLYAIGDTAFQKGSNAWWGPITASSPGAGTPVAPPQPTIAISGTAVSHGAANATTVGTVTTTVGAGTYTWTYSLLGADSASFSIASGVVKTVGALADRNYAVTISAVPSPTIIGAPFTLPITISVGTVGVGAVTIPGVGWSATSGNETSLLSPSQTMFTEYNHYASWAECGMMGYPGGPNSPSNNGVLISWQVSPGPIPSKSGIAFNIGTYLANATAFGQQLGNTCLSIGQNKIQTLNLCWEWNQGGACDFGWDNGGNNAAFITFWRLAAQQIRNIAPNVIIGWCANGTPMRAGGTLADWYPGDDLCDAIIFDAYQDYMGDNGSLNLSNPSNYYAFMTTFSNATYLGSAHPAAASGSMVINGVSTVIRKGGRKYVALPEYEAVNGVEPNFYVRDVFNWGINNIPGRLLHLNYWNSLSSKANGIVLNGAQDAGNASGSQFLAAISGKTYNGTYPLPRLSS